MNETALHDLDQYRAAIAEHPRVLLYKHSPICPTSATALREWEAFGREQPTPAALRGRRLLPCHGARAGGGVRCGSTSSRCRSSKSWRC